MTMRTFLDSEGTEWRAFDVVPRAEERRATERRGSGETIGYFSDRRQDDRRVTVGGRKSLVGLTEGWLCFEMTRGADRRRLAPIPQDWQRSSDAALDEYRRRAREVRQNSVSLGELAHRGR